MSRGPTIGHTIYYILVMQSKPASFRVTNVIIDTIVHESVGGLRKLPQVTLAKIYRHD